MAVTSGMRVYEFYELEGGGGGVKILYARLSMYDRPMETVKYMCVNIRCMLDWFAGLAEIHFLKI